MSVRERRPEPGEGEPRVYRRLIALPPATYDLYDLATVLCLSEEEAEALIGLVQADGLVDERLPRLVWGETNSRGHRVVTIERS
ncbi:MAG TPA: hypothetical protein VHN99_11875 [Deinococcales bacterium]|nr:hypothetical protein [Deinococcales bacterium]